MIGELGLSKLYLLLYKAEEPLGTCHHYNKAWIDWNNDLASWGW